jgi:prepilin-type N-terminal cleavage/methylation domain-containing protein
MTRQPVQSRSRNGFTLLEVVIALGLLLFLMTLVYTALDSYWTLSSKGQREMEQSQLARAIFDRISLDLRSIAFVPVEEDAESMDDEDDEESDAPAAVMVVDPTAAFEEAINGLVGDINQLVLHVSRPSRDAEYVSLGGSVDPTMQASDLQIVTYLTAEQGGNGLSGVIGSVLPDTIDSRSQILGLARVQGDAMVMQMAQDAADNSVLAESAQLLAAEVVSIEFAYYENGAVYESWDTREYNRLPQAVEIKLGFRQDQSEFAEGSRFTTAMDAPSRVFRKVVSLPLAGAYVEETY